MKFANALKQLVTTETVVYQKNCETVANCTQARRRDGWRLPNHSALSTNAILNEHMIRLI